MTGTNPKATTDEVALDYIERNYNGGSSGGTTILDIGEIFKGYELLATEDYGIGDRPQYVNVPLTSYVSDMRTYGANIPQELIDSVSSQIKSMYQQENISNITIKGINMWDEVQAAPANIIMGDYYIVSFTEFAIYKNNQQKNVKGMQDVGLAYYPEMDRTEVYFSFTPFVEE